MSGGASLTYALSIDLPLQHNQSPSWIDFIRAKMKGVDPQESHCLEHKVGKGKTRAHVFHCSCNQQFTVYKARESFLHAYGTLLCPDLNGFLEKEVCPFIDAKSRSSIHVCCKAGRHFCPSARFLLFRWKFISNPSPFPALIFPS